MRTRLRDSARPDPASLRAGAAEQEKADDGRGSEDQQRDRAAQEEFEQAVSEAEEGVRLLASRLCRAEQQIATTDWQHVKQKETTKVEVKCCQHPQQQSETVNVQRAAQERCE